ncbi:tRNA threonylcarbamoyladenosine biosynthesis protein TsaE [Sphingobium xanthum]|jgi:tRNA threonylcarbamoyladenosine biosynthesis protein TsaE|uniref:tRNA (adenosine(37)-N6)-threonylcarbamoyltransferase complex ATPase subunit type 1 TsaE n=1 Tax=Sphingobium xanthum TaxID=1387165 RepID=UPI001C8CC81C|nr:tRNA (adenosine(37)-N6)-threonylcarbamoyltransferase complex ATPase subunit type 1 TsaE [Sphingobium xanthum]
MPDTQLAAATPDAMEALGRRLGARLQSGDIVTLQGGLGAGKTTFARGVLRGLGFAADVPSPTFAILQGYEPPETRLSLGHVDLYRIEQPDELDELGLDDWLEGGALVIEWPERLGTLYADLALAIHIDTADDGGRLLTARVPKSWEGRWPLP